VPKLSTNRPPSHASSCMTGITIHSERRATFAAAALSRSAMSPISEHLAARPVKKQSHTGAEVATSAQCGIRESAGASSLSPHVVELSTEHGAKPSSSTALHFRGRGAALRAQKHKTHPQSP
jgi:hypothetical protein